MLAQDHTQTRKTRISNIAYSLPSKFLLPDLLLICTLSMTFQEITMTLLHPKLAYRLLRSSYPSTLCTARVRCAVVALHVISASNIRI